MYGNPPSINNKVPFSQGTGVTDLPSNITELINQSRNAMYEVRSFRSRLDRKNMQLIAASPASLASSESVVDIREGQSLIAELSEVNMQLLNELFKLSETIAVTETI